MQQQKKKRFSVSNIITGLLIVLAVSMLIFPNFKAGVLQVLMRAGLFKPDVAATPVNPSKTAKNWSVQLLSEDGELLDGADLQGKVVFVNSWATWCPPCIAEMPSINQLYQRFQHEKDLLFLMVDADGNLQKSSAFLRQKNLQLPLYIARTSLPSEWFTGTLPTTIVLNKQGNLVYHHEGVANYNSDQFVNFIRQLLQQ